MLKRSFAILALCLSMASSALAADWSKPTLTDAYTNFLTYLNNRLNDVALSLDSGSTSPTNLPTGAKRWNASSNKWEKWSGSAWSDLATTYGISITGNAGTSTNSSALNSYVQNTGTTASTIPVRDGSGKLPGDITGNAATATNIGWSGVTGKPTTLSGYGITDAVKDVTNWTSGLNNITKGGFYYIQSDVTNSPTNSAGHCTHVAHSDSLTYAVQYFTSTATDDFWMRQKTGTWNAWVKLQKEFPVGSVIGFAKTNSPTNTQQITVVVPQDDSVPQVSETASVASITYASRRANSLLRIRYSASGVGDSGGGSWVLALFVDGNTDATYVSWGVSSDTWMANYSFEAVVPVANTNNHTYTIRMAVVGGSLTLNAIGATPSHVFGAASGGLMTIEEIAQ